MNPRSLILIVLAGVGVMVVVFLTRSYLGGIQSQQTAQVARQEVATAKIMVAARKLPVGTIIKPEDVKWQPWPEAGVTEAYYSSRNTKEQKAETPKGLAGKVVRSPISAGEPVTRTALVSQGERGFLAAILTPGMRATTIKVSATSGIGGFIFPGDRVDVILTHAVEVSRTERYNISETVFQNVRVLGVDQRTAATGDQVRVAKTATIEVTPKMVEKVAMLENIGSLSLSLRSLAHGADGLPADPESPPVDRTLSHTMGDEISEFIPAMDAEKGATLRVARGSVSSVVTLGRTKEESEK